MKQLKDFADSINKCSKCGMCQAVCPVFKATGNECAVSKGKFVMLDGVLKGDLKLSKTINKYLEMCLKCDKCSKFCPSGIDVCEIFRTAKSEYLTNSPEGKFVKFLESELIFDNLINLAGIFNSGKQHSNPKNPVKKLLFFKGCANKLFKSSDNAVKDIFSRTCYSLIENDKLKCCGVPFLSSGNLSRYESVENFNTELINQIDCDAVITDCASCMTVLQKYPELQKPVIDFTEFLVNENIKFRFDKPVRVTFHKPCHYDKYNVFKKLIQNCENAEYTEMPEYDECCGFAGQFAFTNRKLSKELSKNKIINALTVNSDIILTTCPACVMGLKQGLSLVKQKNKPKVMNITEFLAAAQIIE